MYDENGEAFGIDINGKEYFYVKNAQNDVIAIVNSNNETVATYRYNSWGKLISCEDTSENQEVSFLNPYTYRSYFYDSDTEMYFLKSRYYNPELHRFISADGIYDTNTGILSHNMFAYCNDEPINRMDIFGTCYYNINGKWCHDNLEYLGGYNRKPEPIDITDKLNDAMHKNAETMNDSKRTKGTVKTATMFYNNVKPGGKWDFKAQKDWGLDSQHIYLYNGTQLRYDDIGNIHYGYVGRTLFSKKTLLLAAGGVQIYTKTSSISYWNSNFDDPRDQWAIEFGCGIWDSEVLS